MQHAWLLAEKQCGRSIEQVIQLSYVCKRVFWLVLFLSVRHSKLCYQKLWDSLDAKRICYKAWCLSASLPRALALRARKKIVRFMSTAYMIDMKMRYIKISTNDHTVVAKVKQSIALVICRIRHGRSFWMAEYLKKRLRLVRTKGPRVDTLLSNHI